MGKQNKYSLWKKIKAIFCSRIVRKLFKWTFILSSLGLLFALAINFWVYIKTDKYIFESTNDMPVNKIALVLGTSKYYRNGNLNQYYQARIDGAAKLYFENKVNYLLLSGDNRQVNYNEPITMRKDLIAMGIPKEDIFLDYAGFRTLDSIVRAKKVFKADNFTIVSQRFHCERALFIAQYQNVDAICLAVKDPYTGRVHFREILAKVAAFLDLYVLNKSPYFLGPTIDIPSNQEIKPVDEASVEQPFSRHMAD